MPQSLSDVAIHIVFSTANRHPWIKTTIESELHSYMVGICRNLDSPVIKINGTEDHIHILLVLGRTISISKLVSELKSNSSRWIKLKDALLCDFAWQRGYGVFSVSRPNIDSVIKYIASQKEHHKTLTFKEELLSLLSRAGLSYDEKYLWD